ARTSTHTDHVLGPILRESAVAVEEAQARGSFRLDLYVARRRDVRYCVADVDRGEPTRLSDDGDALAPGRRQPERVHRAGRCRNGGVEGRRCRIDATERLAQPLDAFARAAGAEQGDDRGGGARLDD